jgi:hypothetical protein
METFDSLLECWVLMSQDKAVIESSSSSSDRRSSSSGSGAVYNSELRRALIDVVYPLYEAYVQCRLTGTLHCLHCCAIELAL